MRTIVGSTTHAISASRAERPGTGAGARPLSTERSTASCAITAIEAASRKRGRNAVYVGSRKSKGARPKDRTTRTARTQAAHNTHGAGHELRGDSAGH
jgi:hypothetical protein